MRRTVALVTTMLALSCTATTAAGAATQPVGSVSVTPGPGSSLAPGGGFFLVSGGPGVAFDQSVTITNSGSSAVSAAVGGVDATTAAGTGVVYGGPADTPARVGTWITPEQTRLDLAPRETKSLRFTVRVPAGVTPGQYLGGLSVAIGTPTSTPSTPASSSAPGFGVAITMQSQRVLAVEVDVPGAPYVPNLVVRNMRFATAGIGRVLAVTIANDGNGFARGDGSIAAAAEGINEPIAVGTFVPGTTAEYQVPWPADAGDLHPTVDVSIDYGGRSLRFSGAVGGTPGAATRHPTVPRHSGGVRIGVVVLVVGGVALALGLVLVLAGRRRRGRSRRRAPARSRTRARQPARRVQRSRGRS